MAPGLAHISVRHGVPLVCFPMAFFAILLSSSSCAALPLLQVDVLSVHLVWHAQCPVHRASQ